MTFSGTCSSHSRRMPESVAGESRSDCAEKSRYALGFSSSGVISLGNGQPPCSDLDVLQPLAENAGKRGGRKQERLRREIEIRVGLFEQRRNLPGERPAAVHHDELRSEERRVGKECRSR